MFKLNFKKIFSVLLCLVIFVSPIHISASSGGYEINSYDVQATYHKNNTISVEETIDVNFTSHRHGIYREIPLTMYVGYTDEEKLQQTQDPDEYRLKIKNIDVTGDSYSVSTEDNVKTIKIGSSMNTIIGEHTYHISYTIVIPEDYRKEYDFMYYSVLGNYWDTNIKTFSFDINFEKELTQSELESFHLFSGYEGSTGNDVSVVYNLTQNGISGTAYYVNPYEAITIYGRLRSDYFEGAYKTLRWPTWVFSIVTFVLGIFGLLRLFKTKKDHITPVVNFYPPNNLDPAAVGYLIDDTSDVVDLMSLVPYWANQGYISIEEKEDHMILYKELDLPENSFVYQNKLFTTLFGGSTQRDMNALPDSFAKNLDIARDQLADSFMGEKSLTKMDVKGILLLVAEIIFLFVAIMTNSKLTLFSGMLYAGVIFAILVLNIFLCFAKSVKLVFSSDVKYRIRQGLAIVLGIVCIVALFVQSQSQSSILPVYWILIVFVTVFSNVFQVSKMNAPTKYWLELAGPLLGFKEFIQKAEIDQLKKLSKENPTYYYHVIPYAMVFGLEKEWTNKFTNIPVQQPTWYRTYSSDPFSTWMFYSSINRGIQQPIHDNVKAYRAEQARAAASSSGGSSGGFSGGGAGGGGGGSW